jgi:hypothetical protein
VSGSLLSSHVGVSLHKVLALGGGGHEQVVVSVEPVNTQVNVVGDGLNHMALILSPDILTTQQLCQVQVWDVTAKLRYNFDHVREPAVALPEV